MGKRLEAALRIKPILQKGAQSLEDAEALEVKGIYSEWKAGISVAEGEKRLYGDKLYKCRKAHTTQADWTPDITPDLWKVIDESHAGTIDDPKIAARGMEYTYGQYYTDPEDGLLYYCWRNGEAAGGVVVLHYLPHELVGQYFETVVVE